MIATLLVVNAGNAGDRQPFQGTFGNVGYVVKMWTNADGCRIANRSGR